MTTKNDNEMRRGGKLGILRPIRLREPHGAHIPHMGGFIHGDTGGRTDNQNISVKHNSYIIPADVVSGLGSGNSLAGARALDSITGVKGSLPSGMPGSLSSGQKEPGATSAMHFASGGMVPIIVASGEYNIPPDAVARIGKGNIIHGHKILDEFVKHVRKKTTKTMSKLPPPKK